MNINLLPPFRNKMILERENAITGDIISVLNKSTSKAINDTKLFSKQFKGKNELVSAFNVWLWVRKNIRYMRDPEGKQIIQLPSALVRNETGGDCKSFSLLIGSLLYNLGCENVRLRYVSYKNDNIPTHVYCVFNYKGMDVPVDGVIDKFNYENKNNFKIDNKMNVYELSGTETENKNSIDKYYKAFLKVKRKTLCSHLIVKKIRTLKNVQQEKTILNARQYDFYLKRLNAHVEYHKRIKSNNICYELIKEELTNLQNDNLTGGIADDITIDGIGKFRLKDLSIKNVVKTLKKFGLAPNRNAFLALVNTNSLNLASRIANSDRDKVKKLWEKLGGDFSKLQKGVNNGLKKGFGNKKHKGEVYGIGTDPATAGIVLSAGTVLVAFLKVLIGGKKQKLDKDGNPLVDKNGKPVLESGADYLEEVKNAGVDIPNKFNELAKVFNITQDGEVMKVKEGVVIADSESGMSSKKLLVGAGILTGIIYLTKSKK